MSMHGEMYGRLLKCGAEALFQEARSRFTGGGNLGYSSKASRVKRRIPGLFFWAGPGTIAVVL